MDEYEPFRVRNASHSGADLVHAHSLVTNTGSHSLRQRNTDSGVQTGRLQDAMTTGSSSHSTKYTNTTQELSTDYRIYQDNEINSRFAAPFLFSDIIIEVEGKTFHSHRAILAMWSPVFQAMFDNSFQENSTGRIKLTNDRAADIGELLLHMYSPGGRDIDSYTAMQLLPLAHRYQISTILASIEKVLSQSITEATALEYYLLADLYDLRTLQSAALERAARLDKSWLDKELPKTTISSEAQLVIYKRRISILEQVIHDIQRSLSITCIKMESKTERVPANHCQAHNRPFSLSTESGEPCSACVDSMRSHLADMCKRALNKTFVSRETCTSADTQT